ncbi:MAG: DUF63 family protein [Candidatus Thermoplasmatota archaeon]|nr:DUF63 family protein [Candidatus Thermoplasmatota archaeon]
MQLRPIVERTLLLLPVLLISIIVLLSILLPHIFYEEFIWKYFWGPIVADAGGDAGGITSDYNWIDTISYGLILAWAVFLIQRAMKRWDVNVDPFFFALAPAILIGPSLRVLEDMYLFNTPLQYVFISPLIYIFLGLSTFGLLYTSIRISYLKDRERRTSSSLLVLIPGLITALVVKAFPEALNANVSIVAILGISLAMSLMYPVIFRKGGYLALLGWTWGTSLLHVIYSYTLWFTDDTWRSNYTAITGSSPSSGYLLHGLGAVALVALAAFLVYVSLRLSSKKWPKLGMMVSPVNMAIVVGHMLDASATFIGVDYLGYVEKHRLPAILMEATGTALVMFPLKLVFLLPALYLIDVSMEEDARSNRYLITLVKLAILVLGFGPGMRDLIRLMLGT